jgi:hypothetical protein
VKENVAKENLAETEKEDIQSFMVIPYVKGTSERIGRVLKKLIISAVFSHHKKLRKVIYLVLVKYFISPPFPHFQSSPINYYFKVFCDIFLSIYF